VERGRTGLRFSAGRFSGEEVSRGFGCIAASADA
jgi:hypothetical protein